MSVCCGIKNKGIFFSHIFHNKYCCCCWLCASFFFSLLYCIEFSRFFLTSSWFPQAEWVSLCVCISFFFLFFYMSVFLPDKTCFFLSLLSKKNPERALLPSKTLSSFSTCTNNKVKWSNEKWNRSIFNSFQL
jgi:hypothetical protein